VKDGSIETFGEDEVARRYRKDRVEMWLRGQISSSIMEEFLEVKK